MLVLERHLSEDIFLRCGCGLIRIVVCKFKSERGRSAVRIGIDAPDSVSIYRSDAKVKEPKRAIAGVFDGPH